MKTAYPFLFGTLIIEYENHIVYGLNIIRDTYTITSEDTNNRSDFSQSVLIQINEYLHGKRTSFDIPFEITGSPFQKQVLQELLNIPYGETRSYKDIAIAIDNPNASRAVGMANHNNPLLLLVPCHRVIASNGNLSGYAAGIDIKQYLLELEKNNHIKHID